MGYQKSNVLKTLNHWQSSDSGYKTYNKHKLKELQSFTIGKNVYIIPPSLFFDGSYFDSSSYDVQFVDPVQSKETGGGLIIHNEIDWYKKMKPLRAFASNYESQNKYIFRGVFDYDRKKMNLHNNFEYLEWPNKYVFLAYAKDTGFVYKGEGGIGSQTEIKQYVVLPVVHRVGIISAWIEKGYQNLLPPFIIDNFPVGEDYIEETFTLEGNPYEPNDGDLSGPHTHIAGNGLISAAKIYPEIFKNEIKIKSNWKINEPSTDLDKYPSCSGYYTTDLNFDKGLYVQGGLTSSNILIITSAYNYQSSGKVVFSQESRQGSYILNENIDLVEGIFRFNQYDTIGAHVENLSYKKIMNEENRQVGAIYCTIDNIIEEFVDEGLQTIFYISKREEP